MLGAEGFAQLTRLCVVDGHVAQAVQWVAAVYDDYMWTGDTARIKVQCPCLVCTVDLITSCTPPMHLVCWCPGILVAADALLGVLPQQRAAKHRLVADLTGPR